MERNDKTAIIIELFEKFTPLSAACREWLQGNLQFKTFSKGSYIFEAGKPPRAIYFIFKGLVHYYVEQEGRSADSDKEVCSWFLSEGDIVIPVVAFYTQSATAESIRALENIDTAYLRVEQLREFYSKFPETNIARAALTEIYRVRERSWHIRLATMSAEENYLYLRQTAGNLIKRIRTNGMLASHLNISKRWVMKLKRKYGD